MVEKKVLIVGPKFYGYNESVARAFNKLGFSTKVLNFLDKDAEGFKEKIALHLSNKQSFFAKKRNEFNAYFKKEYDAYNPQIIFIIKGSILEPSSIDYAKDSIKILWMMDSIYANANSYKIRNAVDHIFLFEQTEIPKLATEGIQAHFLPLALDESVYYPIESKKDIDLLFVGALYPNRIKLLDKIIKAFPEINIKIYGSFFSPWRKPFKFLFRKDKFIYLNKNVQPSELNKLYSRSKVCLNIHHIQSVDGVNQRFFEILGAASLEVTDYKIFLQNNFTSNEVLSYTTEEELMTIVKNVFTNYSEYEKVKQNGYQKVLTNHTFTNRIQQILQILTIQNKL